MSANKQILKLKPYPGYVGLSKSRNLSFFTLDIFNTFYHLNADKVKTVQKGIFQLLLRIQTGIGHISTLTSKH